MTGWLLWVIAAGVLGVGEMLTTGWTARSLLDDQVIESGTRVEVVEIKGATALVAQ
jgi:membrane protein implicated in regulation of membrane protease activity